MTTEEKFNAAVNVIRSLPKNGSYQPSNELMLKFYSYFKQATEGPCTGSRPGFWDIVGRAKYDAWKKLGDMPRKTAMAKYVDELHSIVETMSLSENVANFLEAPTNELESISLDDLELIAGDVLEKVRSQPNSPLASRENSPIRFKGSPTPSSANSVSPPPYGDKEDSDFSDEEYIDTVENPEPRRTFAAQSISNGGVQHQSRLRTRTTSIDISQEISKAVQSLQLDMEKLNSRVNALEKSNKNVASRRGGGLFTGLSPQLVIFLIIWPFVATILTNRLLLKRK